MYIAKDDFTRINAAREAAGLDTFKNPRNLASGSIKLMDPSELKSRPMKVLLYEVLDGERVASSHLASLELLGRWGVAYFQL